MFPYEPTIEQSMKDYFETLSEKDKRRYAGVEVLKFTSLSLNALPPLAAVNFLMGVSHVSKK